MAKSCKGLAAELVKCLSESDCVTLQNSNHSLSLPLSLSPSLSPSPPLSIIFKMLPFNSEEHNQLVHQDKVDDEKEFETIDKLTDHEIDVGDVEKLKDEKTVFSKRKLKCGYLQKKKRPKTANGDSDSQDIDQTTDEVETLGSVSSVPVFTPPTCEERNKKMKKLSDLKLNKLVDKLEDEEPPSLVVTEVKMEAEDGEVVNGAKGVNGTNEVNGTNGATDEALLPPPPVPADCATNSVPESQELNKLEDAIKRYCKIFETMASKLPDGGRNIKEKITSLRLKKESRERYLLFMERDPLPIFKREAYNNSFQVSGTPGKHQ